MNRRFLATVILCSVLPLLVAAAVIYYTYAGAERRRIESSLVLEAEYKSREISGYLSAKKQGLSLLSGLGLFSVAAEYQRYEGLTRFFDQIMKSESGYSGVCFLGMDKKVLACNEYGRDGRYLEGNRADMGRYAAAVDFKSVWPWQFVRYGGAPVPVLLSRVTGGGGKQIGYLLVVLRREEVEDLIASFVEKYQKQSGIGLEYMVSAKSDGSYSRIMRSPGFEYEEEGAPELQSGRIKSGNKQVVWSTSGNAYGVRTFFQIPETVFLARLREVRVIYFSVIALFVAAVAFLIAYITKYSFRSIEILLSKMEAMSKGNYSRINQPGLAGDKYIDYANQLIDRILSYEENSRKELQLSVLGKMASQVAHDIRSPLAALDSVEKDLLGLSEEKRILVRSSIGRIRDIANDLLEKNRTLAAPAEGGALTPHLLSALVESAVTEKRLQFRAKIGVEIDVRLEKDSYGLFSVIAPSEFKRVLSNVMNNAVEAIEKAGSVLITMRAEGGEVVLSVKDTGRGIAPEALAGLFRRGETRGKEGGSGLGLFHAREALAGWGGTIGLRSEPGRGTEVLIRLPRAETPDWFLPKLDVEPGATVVVLDDDTSIHQVWQGRFESLKAGERGVKLAHFSTPAELRAWVKESGAAAGAVYLLDYELLGFTETGVTLAEELALGPRAALVTSRYEEEHILEHCRRLKMRMMPKGLAGNIPIVIGAGAAASSGLTVLIDDDPLVRMNWKAAARAKGAELRVFASVEEFGAAGSIPKDAVVYIDSELGGGVKGEEFAEALKNRGYTDLTLETGHPAANFSGRPWLKVTGKEPPWA